MNFFPLPHAHTDADYQRAVCTVNQLEDEIEDLRTLIGIKGKPKKAALSDLPVPVKKDKHGVLVADYSYRDWFAKIAEEVFEAHAEAKEERTYSPTNDGSIDVYRENIPRTAEELADVITVCVSFLDVLGYDEKERGDLYRKINQKNLQRGYLE